MSKHEFELSQPGQQNEGKENSIVQMPAGSYKLTEEDREQLASLAARPDSEIDFSDIPRLTPEEYETTKRMIIEKRKNRLQKAS